MPIRTTTNCVIHNHPEFQITYDAAKLPIDDDLDWLIKWLEQSVALGERYAPDQTCQIGWMLTEIRQNESGLLTFWEPDMKQFPIVWTESVSQTISQLRIQKDVVESVLTSADLSFPSLRQSAIICVRLGQSDGLIMERSIPSDELDSGWFCGCREDHDHQDVSELRRVSLYEAAVRHTSRIIPYLALPTETLVNEIDGLPTIYSQDKQLDCKPNSYLARIHSNSK